MAAVDVILIGYAGFLDLWLTWSYTKSSPSYWWALLLATLTALTLLAGVVLAPMLVVTRARDLVSSSTLLKALMLETGVGVLGAISTGLLLVALAFLTAGRGTGMF